MKLKVLIGCEESQTVCKEFRRLGHESYSCDLQDCSGGHPEWHFKMDVFEALKLKNWDLFICHPECRFLCFSGERWLKDNPERLHKRLQAYEFFKKLYNYPLKRKCLENSHSIFLEREFRKPDQYLHPYHFGDPYKKLTCLWLSGLPPIIPTNIVFKRESKCHKMPPGPERSKMRSKTYTGIAKAMAEQWSEYIINQKLNK